MTLSPPRAPQPSRRPRAPSSRASWASAATVRSGSSPTPRSIEKINSSDEWIRERSGIISRRFAAPDESVVDMAEHAAREALGARRSRGRPDRRGHRRHRHAPLPDPGRRARSSPTASASTAPRSTSPRRAPATATALAVADDMVRGGSAQHVLVVGVEKLSDFTDPYDRGSAFIFGDGAGAAIVGPSDTPAIGPTVWGSDGSPVEDHLPAGRRWLETRDEEHRLAGHHHGGADRSSGGRSGAWPRWPRRPSTRPGVTAEDLDAFIPHQANMRIIDAMIKQLKLPDGHPRGARHRRDGQHLRRLHPPGHRADAARGRGAPRRPRPADRLRRGAGVRRPGRRPALTKTPAGLTGVSGHSRTQNTKRTLRSETDGAERAGDPRGSGRDRQRGDRSGHRLRRSPTSPSRRTSTSTRCR